MLASLFKILLFVVIVAALAMGATYLLDGDNLLLGDVLITFAGTEYTFSPIQTVIFLGVLTLAIWVILKLMAFLVAVLHFINGDETAITRFFIRNRERRGYQALSDSLLALASGEGNLAMTKATKADRYLQKPELTNLLLAQAAELAGDKNKATATYRKLIENPQTRFVGIRGIMKQKLSDGDTDIALQLAQKAFEIKPAHVETQDVLLQLQTQTGDWAGARKTLSTKFKKGAIPRDLHKRRDAVLALSAAKNVTDDSSTIDQKEAAIEANKLSPDLVPAAVIAAHAYIDQGKPRLATRIINKAWQSQPHPDLAAVFAQIAPNETAEKRLKRFEKLARLNENHVESRLMLAELHLTREDFPSAQRVLGDLIKNNPDARILTIMAAIERGQGADDAVVRGWLTKALSARPGPQWVCSNCNTVHSEWQSVCTNCQALDTFSWTQPSHSENKNTNGSELLPVLIDPSNNSVSEAETSENIDQKDSAQTVETQISDTENDKPSSVPA